MLVIDAATRRGAESAVRDPAITAALRRTAEAALAVGPFSVMDKAVVPPSGDRHDFMSLGTYWWPDPDRPDGVPYIRRDGQVNPEIERLDRPRLSQMVDAVSVLAASWHLLREPAHSARAGLLLRTWFLDPATRMNPHLRFGQGIPGRCEGRCIGIIDSECLARVVDALALLVGAPGWSDADRAGLDSWLGSYLDWLLEDPLGRAEADERNNHGTCYDVQVVALARHLGRDALVRGVLAAVPGRRILVQIEADGRQPLELARTRAWTYSLKNLAALLNLAGWSRELGIDLWGFRGVDGRGIPAALDLLAPVALAGAAWPYPELGGCRPAALLPALVRSTVFDPARRAALAAAGVDEDAIALQVFTSCPLGAVGGRHGFH